MSFPPELIDRILKYLRDDPQSLLAASLVSKAWAGWGQAYLFESVHLIPVNLRGWRQNVFPDVDGPASHTRTLTLEEYRLLPWINPQSSIFPLSNLISFTNVRSLVLVRWNTTLFNGASPEPYFISKTVRLLWRCARHSDHIATITTDIPFGDTEAHSATETPDGFADASVTLASHCVH